VLVPASVGLSLALLFVLGAMLAFDPIALAALPAWPKAVVRIFSWVTLLGDSAVYLVPAGLALVVLSMVVPVGRRADSAVRHLALRLAFLFMAVAGTGILVNVVKRMIGRARPFHVEAGTPFSFEPFGWASKWASFPSGHATTAAAAATVLVLLLGRGMIPWAVAGVALVCASRIVVGAHFVSDVLAGALFGCLGTLWLAGFLAQRGLVFRTSPEGSLALKGEAASKTLRAWLVRGRAP
jgi:membrane-associated phospholipid phosphatase